jgi:spore germination protein YaaH
MDAGTNWGQNDTYYLWYKVTDRTSNADTQGSWYWYRTQIRKTSYTDYTKLFTYSRNVTTATEPTPSSTISDITKLVRYIINN